MSRAARGGIEGAIKRLLVAELGVAPEAVATMHSDTPLLGRGVGLDSMEAMALAVAIEREFDIHFDDGELTARLFADLGTLAESVARKLPAAGGRSA